MFTSVKLKNFRSFKEIKFDLASKKNTPKHIAIVYGENGVGKSNLMSAFVLLNELLVTMNVRDIYEDIISRKDFFSDENISQEIRRQLLDGLRDMQTLINDYKMIGSDEPIVAEYEFVIGQNPGRYIVELKQSELVHERLEYMLNKRRGVYFDCSNDGISINSSIVTNKDLLTDIKASLKRFWGKHSTLAIILHEMQDKSAAYGWDNISNNFDDLLGEFLTMSSFLGLGSRNWNKLSSPIYALQNATEGQISSSDEFRLDGIEKALSQFFSAINGDIKRVYYKRIYNDKQIEYELYFEKLISGEYRNIPFSKESTGNHQLLKDLCYIFSACFGGTVVIDEADTGIHDVLFQKIIKEIEPQINGQLIMTTHNTLLMEEDFARDATYIISESDGGHKDIRCITDFDKRTYLSNNIRNKYLNNEYGGVPEVTPIDFDSLLGILSSAIEIEK